MTTALGRGIAGVMGNDPELVRRLIDVGRETGEPMWELPLVEEYLSGLDSPIADLKNTGDGTAGTIFGGLFLREFVGGLPWAHLDIAAVAFADKGRPYVPRGAVGLGRAYAGRSGRARGARRLSARVQPAARSARISSADFGTACESTSCPAAVTSTSSSMRMPMPRYSRGRRQACSAK